MITLGAIVLNISFFALAAFWVERQGGGDDE